MNQYQPAPAGEIEAEIVAASVGCVAWKASDDNPRGECLRLREGWQHPRHRCPLAAGSTLA